MSVTTTDLTALAPTLSTLGVSEIVSLVWLVTPVTLPLGVPFEGIWVTTSTSGSVVDPLLPARSVVVTL